MMNPYSMILFFIHIILNRSIAYSYETEKSIFAEMSKNFGKYRSENNFVAH